MFLYYFLWQIKITTVQWWLKFYDRLKLQLSSDEYDRLKLQLSNDEWNFKCNRINYFLWLLILYL